MPTPRIRMFAGPNGSGKSTLKEVISEDLIGIYINADEIEKEIRDTSELALGRFEITSAGEELCAAIESDNRLTNVSIKADANSDRLHFESESIDSYLSSVISEKIREILLTQNKSFTFETVMSHESKPEILEKAQALGYRTYLYYIATEDPEINVSRVAYRVSQNGHNVPEDKIISRYYRSLKLLRRAILATNRTYIFDNSGRPNERTWFAEVTDGKVLEYKNDTIPAWFNKYVIE